MGQITVRVNGREFPVGCADGEEDHVARLAQYFDSRVKQVAKQVGALGDAHLMLLASLMVADELSEAYGKLEGGEGGGGDLAMAGSETALAQVCETLDSVAQRVENIAARLESA